ncbi:MAG TPA: universal stress protein, partial [Solirubrobacterales bacterium]|nr:universal stress protein [Solirubrobacterales bacterium]
MSGASAEEGQRQPRAPEPHLEGFAHAHRGRERGSSPFSDVLCAVDGSRGSGEAVRQAIALCRPGASLRFIAVHQTRGRGLTAATGLSEQQARDALDEAALLARQADIDVSTELHGGVRTSDVLLGEAEHHDLLVIGGYGGKRIGGIMLGNTATRIAHRSARPLLVARRTADGSDFPQCVLLASDGTAGSWTAARIATRVAQARGSELRVAHVPVGVHPDRDREVANQLVMIERAVGAPPDVSETPGQPAERIAEAARAHQASL